MISIILIIVSLITVAQSSTKSLPVYDVAKISRNRYLNDSCISYKPTTGFGTYPEGTIFDTCDSSAFKHLKCHQGVCKGDEGFKCIFNDDCISNQCVDGNCRNGKQSNLDESCYTNYVTGLKCEQGFICKFPSMVNFNGKCKKDVGMLCKKNDECYYDNCYHGLCERPGFNEQCQSDHQCQSGLSCKSNINKCRRKDGEYCRDNHDDRCYNQCHRDADFYPFSCDDYVSRKGPNGGTSMKLGSMVPKQLQLPL